MGNLLHIRVSKNMKKKIQEFIDEGLFSNQAEIAREAIRHLILKYSKDLETKSKNEKTNKNQK